MRFFSSRTGLAALLFAFALTPASDTRASVSIQAAYEPLVRASDAVDVVTALESMSQWEDGKIYTYTLVRVDDPVAGSLGLGAETWIRTRGGVVGKIGQNVDGEASLPNGSRSLLFLRHGPGATFEVNARAQGQYPVIAEPKTGRAKLARSASVGILYPARNAKATRAASGVELQAERSELPPVTAAEVLVERPLDESVRRIAQDWKRLHKKP